MSYILDALKKSEAERSSRDHPEFAHRVPFESTPRKQREIWPYLLLLALMANALVIGYVVWPESAADDAAVVSGEPVPVQRQQPVERETANTAPESPTQAETETTAKPETSDKSGASASAPVIAEDSPSEPAGETLQADSSDVPAREKPTQEESTPEEEVPDINAMPSSVQRRVPEMTFNAHLYSSKPSSRQVMINNRMLREGDRVGDLVIDEITAAGVVFRLDGHVFQIGIVRDWQGAH